jgi:hypothetical protein
VRGAARKGGPYRDTNYETRNDCFLRAFFISFGYDDCRGDSQLSSRMQQISFMLRR